MCRCLTLRRCRSFSWRRSASPPPTGQSPFPLCHATDAIILVSSIHYLRQRRITSPILSPTAHLRRLAPFTVSRPWIQRIYYVRRYPRRPVTVSPLPNLHRQLRCRPWCTARLPKMPSTLLPAPKLSTDMRMETHNLWTRRYIATTAIQ